MNASVPVEFSCGKQQFHAFQKHSRPTHTHWHTNTCATTNNHLIYEVLLLPFCFAVKQLAVRQMTRNRKCQCIVVAEISEKVVIYNRLRCPNP